MTNYRFDAQNARTAALACWGTPANTISQPEPPADGEVADLVGWLRCQKGQIPGGYTEFDRRIDRAADLLERMVEPEPVGATDNELAVNLQIDTTPECLKRLCDGLAAAVRPNGGYKAATLDDPAPGTGCDQMVLVEWWVPQHGCDSLENTLDAIRFRLIGAVRDWWATALVPQTEPVRPTDEELWALGNEDFRANCYPTDAIRYARAVLARWGSQS